MFHKLVLTPPDNCVDSEYKIFNNNYCSLHKLTSHVPLVAFKCAIYLAFECCLALKTCW